MCVRVKRHHQYADGIAIKSMNDPSGRPLLLETRDQAIRLLRTDASVLRKSVSGVGAGVAVGAAASFCEEHAERAPRATTMHTSRGANIP